MRWVLWAALWLGLTHNGRAETLDSGDTEDDATEGVDSGERDRASDYEGSSRRLGAKGSGEHPVLFVEAVFPHYAIGRPVSEPATSRPSRFPILNSERA